MERRPRGLSAYYLNEEERLQEILGDKSVLALPLLSKDNWIKNDQRPHCYYCQRKFRPFVRKQHHCRACGEIVCRHCNRHRKVAVGASGDQTITVRLCFDCIDKAMIDAGKPESNHSGPDDAETPDCNFMNKSLNASSSAATASSTMSTRSSAAITDSMASLEFSICESGASDFEYDSASEAESDSEVESSSSYDSSSSNSSSSFRASRRRQQISRSYSSHIEFLPEEEQHEIYEIRRQELLELYGIMDSGGQTEYDALCELASRALECNVAAVGFVDSTRQWYKARLGISQSELPRNVAFCSQLLQNVLPTIVMDASRDSRFGTNPLVTGSAGIHFYATTPICDPGTGIVIGSVFVMDPKPKTALPPRAMEILAYLSTAAEKLLLSVKKADSKQQPSSSPHQQSERRSTIHKRKQRVHSAPAIPTVDEEQFSYNDNRAASLQCVPEELETKDEFAGISHAIPRDKRERELYQLIDPDLLLPHNLPRRQSESVLAASPGRSSVFSDRSSSSVSSVSSVSASDEELSIVPPPPTMQKSELSRLHTESSVTTQPGAATRPDTNGGVCFDLICRITSTQQLLAEQQSAFLETLTQHSTRIGSMEKTMGRIEGIMHSLYLNNTSGDGGGDGSYEVEI